MSAKNFLYIFSVIFLMGLFVGALAPAEAALPPLCSLTYTAGEGGTIDGVPQVMLRVRSGTEGREVEAIPDSGYIFVDWDDEVTTARRSDFCPGGRGRLFMANFRRIGVPSLFIPSGAGVGVNNRLVTMNDRGFVGVIDNLGTNVFVYLWSQAEFELIPSNSNVPERHELKVTNLDMINRVVTFEISSETQTFSVAIDEELYVDLNKDKINDLYVKFEDLVINRIELTLMSVDNTVIADETSCETCGEILVPKYVFERDLYLNVSGADVKELQKFLNNNGFVVATEGPGSAGNETETFGSLTKQALIKYQLANGISPALGYLGPITRAKINQ